MIKNIKFPLKLKNDVQVRNIEELRTNFDLEKILGYFIDGRLLKWLESHRYDTQAEAIRNLDKSDKELAMSILKIFQVKPESFSAIDIREIEEKNAKQARLKLYATEQSVIDAVEQVAFDQLDLERLINQGKFKDIYLCSNVFRIPAKATDKNFIGIGKVKVASDIFLDFEEKQITFKDVEIDADYQNGIKQELMEKYAEAFEFFTKSASKDNYLAHFKLGNYFYKGVGKPKDYVQALKHYEQAAMKKDYRAALKISSIYLNGYGVEASKEKWLEWQEKAADMNPFIQFLVGMNYATGANPFYEKNPTKGLECIKSSAEKGCVRAMYVLGIIYAGGYSKFGEFQINRNEAAKWLNLGVKQDDIYSMCALYHLSDPYIDWTEEMPSDKHVAYFCDKETRGQIHERMVKLADSKNFYDLKVLSKLCLAGNGGFEKDVRKSWEYFKQAVILGYKVSSCDINEDLKKMSEQSPDLQEEIKELLPTMRIEKM